MGNSCEFVSITVSDACSLQVRCSLQLEPAEVPSEGLQPGTTIPEISVAVVNGFGSRTVRGTVGGERQAYSIVQQLWHTHGAS